MPNKCWCGNEHLNNYSEEYYKCDKCYSLVSKKDFDDSITHITDEDNDLYGKNYWESKMLNLSEMKSLSDLIDMYLKDRCVYWVKYLLKYILPGTSVAEVGCGLGQFPYLLKQMGYAQEAFELSKCICDYSSKELNINISNESILNCKSNFDAILAFDLIEHIYDPKKFIRELLVKLKPDGILCFQTPCYDEKLSYEEMLNIKPRFKNLLTPDEHIYIFSKTSIKYLLKSVGINYLSFEPAFFGNDYDMFVFASRNSMELNENKEIEDALNHTQNGRIMKALISLFDKLIEVKQKQFITENDASKRLENIDILTKQLKSTEEDSKKRLENIEELINQLEISEKDRLNRLENVETLTRLLEISEADRSARLDVINNQNEIIETIKEENENTKHIYEEINLLYNKTKLENDKLLFERNDLKTTLKNLKRLLFHK